MFKASTIAWAVGMAQEALGGAGLPCRTGVYPCAGLDAKPLVRLDPAVLANLGAGDAPAPDVFVYVDRAVPEAGVEPFALAEADAQVACVSQMAGRLGGDACHLFALQTRVRAKPGVAWRERRVAVLYVEADHREFVLRQAAEGFVPDLVIGVSDGCILGGNPRCVNQLVLRHAHQRAAWGPCAPEYYVADHFRNARVAPGAAVTSTASGFPHAFEPLALLDRHWGEYSRHSPLGGATLFRVVPAGSILRRSP